MRKFFHRPKNAITSTCGGLRVTAPDARSPHFTLQRLEDGVFAALATDAGFGLCNSGVVDLGDVTLVFDSMLTPQAGADLRQAAERLTGNPVGYLVNSHYHGDHVRGNVSFPQVRIVSTRKVKELIEERALKALESDRAGVSRDLEDLHEGRLPAGPRDRAIFEGWFQGILATPSGTAIPGPDLLVEDRLVLRGPKREVYVMTFGGGHSPSDVLAYCPEERVAFLGDLLSNGLHPGVTDGYPAEWVRILDSVRALGIDRAVPGHGPLGSETEIGVLQGYLSTLLRLGAAAHRSGLTREEVRRTPVPPAFADWNFRAFFPDNLLRAYDQTKPKS